MNPARVYFDCLVLSHYPMISLLHHVDLITRSRNRAEIEAAVVTAVNRLLGAVRTELYKIFMPPGDVLVGLSAEISADNDLVLLHDEGFSWPEKTSSIENYPWLQECFDNKGSHRQTLPDGSSHQVFMLRTEAHEPYGFIVILRSEPLIDKEIDTVSGLSALLRNTLAMLDYSETDTLTRLLNRKTFDEYLIRILANCPPQDDSLSGALYLPQRRHLSPEARNHWLGVMDIDHFKSINDRFGHLIGDEVLILMANLMRESFRVQDKLFRFGGEEFIALLRPAEFDHAKGTFERFRQRVEAFPFPQVGRVTISIGFTRIVIGDTPSVVLDGADEALYWAKEHGRNQCHEYETLVREGKLLRPVVVPSDIELF